jgi:hypothetical protein
MEAHEVVNHALKVLDTVLRDSPRFTGKINIEVNCNSGGISSVTAHEKKKISISG